MSSAATAGPPHYHHSRSLNVGGSVGSSGSSNGMNFPAPGGGRPQKRIYPHINDLLATRPDINIQAPIRRILQEGNMFASQAMTHIDFGRPDVALQEYIKAYIIAVEILPRHKDYPELQADRGEIHRAYVTLKQKINTQHENFEKVKETIKRDNLNNGTRPLQDNETANTAKVEHRDSQTEKSHSRSQSTQEFYVNGIGLGNGGLYHSTVMDKEVDKESDPLAPMKRKPPPMQPKPPGLHGNSITPTKHNATKSQDFKSTDLASRFANLRAGPSPGRAAQDPRVRTQPIEMPKASDFISQASPSLNSYPYPKPQGPREMPSVPAAPPRPRKLPLTTELPSMPRAPDATYSPARNINTPAGIDPPRSTPRSMYSLSGRAGSMVSVNGTTPRNDIDSYFPATPKTSVVKPPKRSEPDLPDSTEITAEQLTEYLRMGSHEVRILLVDIRPREQFDEGHIMSQSIICVEPVSLHKDISAEEIVEALILSPENEEKLFDQRNDFDLVVFYDNSSTSITYRSQISSNANPLDDFSKAVYEYAYSKRLKRRPVLLKGGLEAWMDLCGEQSLQISQTVSYVKEALGKRKFVRAGPPTRRPPGAPNRRPELQKYNSRPLSEKEEQHWEAELMKDQQPGPFVDQDGEWDEASFVKTTDDFFRRFPDPSDIKESMISSIPQDPIVTNSPQGPQGPQASVTRQDGPGSYEYRTFDEMNSMFPAMPARPPLARARNTAPGVNNNRPTGPVEFDKSPTLANPSGRTGLHNFGATCYMSATIQCLCATEIFTTHLLSGAWSKNPPQPKRNETSRPPQLMTKNLAFLFRHFFQGKYEHVVPRTLKDYIYRVSARGLPQPEASRFGGVNQQDASEFFIWILGIMEDEQNPNRVNELPEKSVAEQDAEAQSLSRLSPLAATNRWWKDHIEPQENSWLTDKFSCVQVYTNTCRTCHKKWYNYDRMVTVQVDLAGGQHNSLENALTAVQHQSEQVEVSCRWTESHKYADRTIAFARLPQILCFTFKRFIFDPTTGGFKKLHSVVNFPPTLKMDQYVAPQAPGDNLPTTMKGPFTYDCYAVCQAGGQTLQSGHYWAQVKDWKKDEWWLMNDAKVSKSSWGATQARETYMVFYKRRN